MNNKRQNIKNSVMFEIAIILKYISDNNEKII